MPEQLEHPILSNLRINELHANQLTTHADFGPHEGLVKHGDLGDGNNQLELGIERLFESELEISKNRLRFDEAQVTGITISGFPGVGKTKLIEQSIEKLPNTIRSAVLEAETSTEIDSDRLRLLGIPTVPIITEQTYQLTSELVTDALNKLDLSEFDVVFIEEDTLNLLSESAYGAHKKVVVLSITNGEELPRMYPQLLAEADCVVITKTDLLPHLEADLGLLLDNIDAINPGLPVYDLSAQSGDGMEAWKNWLMKQLDNSVVEEADLMYAEKPVYVPFIG